MAQFFDFANDKFTRGIIRRKVRQLIRQTGFSKGDFESLEQSMLIKVMEAWPLFDSTIAHHKSFITTVVERYAGTLAKQVIAPRNRLKSLQSLNTSVPVPGELPTDLQYTLEESVGDARLQIGRKSTQQTCDLIADLATEISKLPEPWQRMLELRKSHTVAQISELMGVPRATLRHWLKQIAKRLEAEGLREYIA